MNAKIVLVSAWFLLVILGASTSPVRGDDRPPNEAAAPKLNAVFERREIVDGQTNATATRVEFWRAHDIVARLIPAQNEGEIWRRMTVDQFAYTRLFLKEQRAIEYTQGDLLALNQTVNWDRLACLIDPRRLAEEFEIIGTGSFQGHPVTRYRETGEVSHLFEVWWIVDLQLPARLVRRREKSVEEFVLLDVITASKALETMPNPAQYLRIDFADLGDNENDPFIRQFINLGGMPEHTHH